MFAYLCSNFVKLSLSWKLQEVPLTPTDEVDASAANGNLLKQPSPKNMKADTAELEKKNVFDRVSFEINFLSPRIELIDQDCTRLPPSGKITSLQPYL